MLRLDQVPLYIRQEKHLKKYISKSVTSARWETKGCQIWSKSLNFSLMINWILSRWIVSISSVSHSFYVGTSFFFQNNRIKDFFFSDKAICQEALLCQFHFPYIFRFSQDYYDWVWIYLNIQYLWQKSKDINPVTLYFGTKSAE